MLQQNNLCLFAPGISLLIQTDVWKTSLCEMHCWGNKGIARTQSPTIKNYALELPTFGVIVGVSLTGVQWRGLTLEEPPSWSWLTSAPGKYAEGSYHFWLDESEFRGLIDANCKLCKRKKTLLKILVLFSTKHGSFNFVNNSLVYSKNNPIW